MNEEWVAGKNPVIETIRSGHPINKIWIAEHSRKGAMQEVIHLAKQQGIIVQFVPKQKMDKVARSVKHQGVLAFIAAYAYIELDELLAQADQGSDPPFFLLLDEISDPHNLGSMIRTADAAGVHGVIIPKRRAVGLTAAVAKASAGALQHMPVARVTNLAQTVDRLKKMGMWICGAEAGAKDDYRSLPFDLPLALIIGSEGKGVSRLLVDKCDFTVRIPLAGKVNSLNASIASAILMYEVYRKRNPLA